MNLNADVSGLAALLPLPEARMSTPRHRVEAQSEEAALIEAVRNGDVASFEPLIAKHQAKVMATVRRYARRESEVDDLAQEVFVKAFQKLGSFRGEAPFEHWLMRLTVRTCYDALRSHRRNREMTMTDLAPEETDWLERAGTGSGQGAAVDADAARQLVRRLLDQLSPPARLVITLLEIEDRSVKEVAALTGWSVPLVKVRAFRARHEMRKLLRRLAVEKYI